MGKYFYSRLQQYKCWRRDCGRRLGRTYCLHLQSWGNNVRVDTDVIKVRMCFGCIDMFQEVPSKRRYKPTAQQDWIISSFWCQELTVVLPIVFNSNWRAQFDSSFVCFVSVEFFVKLMKSRTTFLSVCNSMYNTMALTDLLHGAESFLKT